MDMTLPDRLPESIRLIFLDVDGVLNNTKTMPNGVLPLIMCPLIPPDHVVGMDRRQVQILNRIVEATNALVVISSSWRNSHGMDETKGTLNRAGFTGHVLCGTPSIGHRRSEEIQTFIDEWLKERPLASFVILDDEESMDHLKANFVHTDPLDGINEIDADKAITLLLGR